MGRPFAPAILFALSLSGAAASSSARANFQANPDPVRPTSRNIFCLRTSPPQRRAVPPIRGLRFPALAIFRRSARSE